MNLSPSLAAAFFLVAVPACADEAFRPAFHFTPEKNWINDPNGLVYHDGEWHMFYQYNPEGEKWGHMSWGHAVSRDLMTWQHLPLALPEKDGVMIFSGSAVMDAANTSGLGKSGNPAMIAIYTGHREGHQDQRIAYSTDKGRTWAQYASNPVLDIDKADFRDPKVFWHTATNRWVMAVSLSTEKKVSFYGSPDLKEWKHLSDFGPAGARGGIWECPDLFELPVENEAGKKKWVLLLNINPGAPAGGSGCQYFTGDFDGTTFKADDSAPAMNVITDFEGDGYEGWTTTGEAFGGGPWLPQGGGISGFHGKKIANSFGPGDSATGKLVSPSFKVDSDWIGFRIGGGNHPGKLGIRLMSDGKEVRTATGANSSHMAWKSWDVRNLRGKDATLEIFDEETGSDWGHLTVDHIVAGNGACPANGEPALWADYGPDYYATVSWADVPKQDGRRIGIGWMSNWAYAEKVPTSPWRGAMTLPRVFSLRKTAEGYRLVQRPVEEFRKLAAGSPAVFSGGSPKEADAWLAGQAALPAMLDVTVKLDDLRGTGSCSLVLADDAGGEVAVGWENGRLFVDRTKAGLVNFHPEFAARHEAPAPVENGKLSLRLIADRTSVEIFAGEGLISMTQQVFLKPGVRRLSLRDTGGAGKVTGLTIQPLAAPQP